MTVPPSSVLCRREDFPCIFRPVFVPFDKTVPLAASLVRSRRQVDAEPAVGRDFGSDGRPLTAVGRGMHGTSQVLAQTPLPSRSRSWDPGRIGLACDNAQPDTARALTTTMASSIRNFRGSITSLDDLRSTLQGAGLPRPLARLASRCAATLCRMEFAPLGSAVNGFSYMSASHNVLLSRAYLDARPIFLAAVNDFDWPTPWHYQKGGSANQQWVWRQKNRQTRLRPGGCGRGAGRGDGEVKGILGKNAAQTGGLSRG